MMDERILIYAQWPLPDEFDDVMPNSDASIVSEAGGGRNSHGVGLQGAGRRWHVEAGEHSGEDLRAKH
jgi:hypothetical protein